LALGQPLRQSLGQPPLHLRHLRHQRLLLLKAFLIQLNIYNEYKEIIFISTCIHWKVNQRFPQSLQKESKSRFDSWTWLSDNHLISNWHESRS
jgi:hypothetical protein